MKSNFLVDNIEKVILAILIIVLLVLIVSYAGGLYLRQTNLEGKLAPIRFPSPPKIINGLDEYKKVLVSLQKERKFSIYENQFQRDGFCKYVELLPPKPLFELKSVKRLPLEIKYKGFIEHRGGVVGQINLKGETYFVKEGAKLADYKILKLTRRYALIENIKNNKIKLPLRETVLSDKYQAEIYLTREDKTIKVKMGDRVKDLQILDILPDYVVLLNKTTGRKEVLK